MLDISGSKNFSRSVSDNGVFQLAEMIKAEGQLAGVRGMPQSKLSPGCCFMPCASAHASPTVPLIKKTEVVLFPLTRKLLRS